MELWGGWGGDNLLSLSAFHIFTFFFFNHVYLGGERKYVPLSILDLPYNLVFEVIIYILKYYIEKNLIKF